MASKAKAPHNIDVAQLSAYHDGMLSDAEKRLVELHLGHCATCRAQLATYSAFGTSLREDTRVAIPPSLNTRLTALFHGDAPMTEAPPLRRGKRSPFRLDSVPLRVTAVTVVLLILVGVGLLLVAPLLGVDRGTVSVVSAANCTDPSVCAVQVQLKGPVDHAAVARSLQIDPPAKVTLSWRGNNTLLVKAAQPLAPGKSYTIRFRPNSSGQAGPIAVQFVAAGGRTPSPTATSAPPTATPTKIPPPVVPLLIPNTTTATPTETETATATITATATVTATTTETRVGGSCKIQPVRGFGTLYQKEPSVATKLGCAVAPERAIDVVVQSFQHGRMILRADSNQVVVVATGHRWHAFPNTFNGTETATPTPGDPVQAFGVVWRAHPDLQAALGRPTGPAQSMGGAAEEFQHGSMLWSADYLITVLYNDGNWAEYTDTYRDTATPTPPASGSGTGSPSSAPTALPTSPTPAPSTVPATAAPVPTATATPAAGTTATCNGQPTNDIGNVYNAQPTVASRLGCATGPGVNMQLARETFQHGLMLWLSGPKQIVVIQSNGTWKMYPDTWQEGEPLADVGPAPAGLVAPVRGFGKVWRDESGVRAALGWGTAPEQSVAGAVESFAHGQMVSTADHEVYVLFEDGTEQMFSH